MSLCFIDLYQWFLFYFNCTVIISLHAKQATTVILLDVCIHLSFWQDVSPLTVIVDAGE
jgi:hypothetical protein